VQKLGTIKVAAGGSDTVWGEGELFYSKSFKKA